MVYFLYNFETCQARGSSSLFPITVLQYMYYVSSPSNNFLFQTTSLAVSWCLHALSQNPKVQDKARQEIFSVLSDNDVISFEDMEKMEYVAAVCKEALRQVLVHGKREP